MPFTITQTTDLCLAQERVGELDLGVVRNIEVLASLRQGNIKLLLEPGIDKGKKGEQGGKVKKRGIIDIKTRDLNTE